MRKLMVRSVRSSSFKAQSSSSFAKELGVSIVHAHPRSRVETHSLEAYRAFTEGWVRLEALDVEEIPKAIADFQKAVAADSRYALAYTGLASAQFARLRDRLDRTTSRTAVCWIRHSHTHDTPRNWTIPSLKRRRHWP